MSRGRYEAPKQGISLVALLWIIVALLVVAALVWGGWRLLSDRNQELDAEDWEQPSTEPSTQAPPETEPPEPTEPPVQEPQLTEAEKQAMEILATMTQEEKVYQLFMVTPEQLTGWGGTVTVTGETSRNAIASKPVGGIIYFSPNLETREQTISMISGLQEASKLGLFISVDEEGGPVVRIADNPNMGTTYFPAMGKISGVEKAYEVGAVTGAEIKELGFNLDFAPVADVFSNPNNKVIGNRAFSSDPKIAAQLVEACTKGFRDSGVLCTLKHFPGHGDTGTDSHYGAAESNKTLEELEACEFLPFKAGIAAGANVVMMGHVTLPNVTQEDLPATLSHEIVTGILREKLGYEGLVITDAMNMGAITNHYSSGEAAVLALNAGVDMILMPNDLNDAVKGVLKALEEGKLTQEQLDEKVLRILQIKIEAGIIKAE